MRVYSYQSASVLAAIMSEEGYVPEWNHCNSCFKEHQTQFEPAYRWLATQYNVRKNTKQESIETFHAITMRFKKEWIANL